MSDSIVTTQSGTRYEFADGKVRRVGGGPLRRDGEWLTLLGPYTVEVGEPMRLTLEPLGKAAYTLRTTTPVVSIEEVDANRCS
jgi:hypothetical protein